jgi:hypothetical protein
MVNYRKMTRLLSLAILGTVGTILVLLNPSYLLFGFLSMFAIVELARNMNFYKLSVMFKRYTRKAARLRFELRMRLHAGFKDYSVSMDDETRNPTQTTGYIR